MATTPSTRPTLFVRGASAAAGPLLIVASTLFTLRGFAFAGRITTADVARYWLPMYTFLGRSLSSGHVPSWNPYALSGTPFLADPQSGWLSVLPMGLFWTLPPEDAIRWLIVAQPVLAGLGMYAFLRAERFSRPLATAAGVSIAMLIAGSTINVTIRFAGALAWTTVALACAAHLARSQTWDRRIGWAVATALAWGQIAGAHLTVGVMIGTGALVVYLVAALSRGVRAGTLSGGAAGGVAGLLVVALVAVNLAVVAPRLAYAERTNLARGYAGLLDESRRLTGVISPRHPGVATDVTWPLNLAVVSGAYPGALLLGLAFAGWWSRRRRGLVAAFSLFAAVGFVATLRSFVNVLPEALTHLAPVDQYLHGPYWMGFAVVLSLPVVGAAGVEAWLEAESWRRRAAMVVPGAAVWLVAPLAFGAPVDLLAYAAVAAVVSGVALLVAARAPVIAAILSVVVAGDVVLSVALRDRHPWFRPAPRLLVARNEPLLESRDVLRAPALARIVAERDDGRTLTLGRPSGGVFIPRQALQNNEGMLYGFESVGGYQAIQLDRYWMFVRWIQRERARYNFSTVVRPHPVLLDLLRVRWLVAQAADEAPPRTRPVARDGPWRLYELRGIPDHATVVHRWTVVPDADAARTAVANPGFDPARSVVLESDPGMESGGSRCEGGRATYVPLGPQAARVDVDTPCPAIVLVRNVHDPGWTARVDDRPVPVIPADAVVQAIPVPRGRHEVSLRYDDPWARLGLAGSGAALAVAAGAAATIALVRRRRRRSAGQVNETEQDPDDSVQVMDPP